MELPINMIVVVLIAVLVLVTVSVFLVGQLGGGTGAINLESAFTKGCSQLTNPVLQNCDPNTAFTVNGYTAPGKTPGTPANFFTEICPAKGYGTPTVCARACGCQLPA